MENQIVRRPIVTFNLFAGRSIVELAIIAPSPWSVVVLTVSPSLTLGLLIMKRREFFLRTDCMTIGSDSRTELGDLVKKIPAASVRG